MSILIKHLKMPKIGEKRTLVIDGNGDVYVNGAFGRQRLVDYAVELPPHGDLVDLSDIVHPNDSMRRMTIDEQLERTCEGWSAYRKQCVVIKAEGSEA